MLAWRHTLPSNPTCTTSCDGTANGPSPSHAAWRLPAWCASPFALRPLLPRLPSTTSAGFGMASGSDLSLCLRPRLLPSVPRTPRPCTSESRWVDSGQRTRTPTNPVSECSAIAGLVALTTAASRWRHCVPFVPFAAPLCSLFPRRVTCAPFENFYFISLNPFFVCEREKFLAVVVVCVSGHRQRTNVRIRGK